MTRCIVGTSISLDAADFGAPYGCECI